MIAQVVLKPVSYIQGIQGIRDSTAFLRRVVKVL